MRKEGIMSPLNFEFVRSANLLNFTTDLVPANLLLRINVFLFYLLYLFSVCIEVVSILTVCFNFLFV